nr:hypothetical protein [Kitasatospora sp. SID7827]
MPAALFTVVARTDLASFADTWVLAFAAGTVLASLLGLLAGRRRERSTAERTVAVMAAGYVNSGNLGIPVAAQVLGDASYAAPVLLFQVLLVTPVVLAVLDATTGAAGGATRPARLRRLTRLPLRNPVILGAGLGALFSAAGWRLPGPQLRAAVLLSALPTAQNVYVYARLYGAAPVLARSAVLVSTVTLSVIAWSLGGG